MPTTATALKIPLEYLGALPARAGLAHAATRLPIARQAIQLMKSQRLAGKAAFLCLSELRVAAAAAGRRRRQFGRRLTTARRRTTLRRRRAAARPQLDEVLALIEEVLGALDATGSAAGGGRAGRAGVGRRSRERTALLPALLRAGDALHARAYADDAAACPSEVALERLLAARWPTPLLASILGAIEEVPLAAAQRTALRERIATASPSRGAATRARSTRSSSRPKIALALAEKYAAADGARGAWAALLLQLAAAPRRARCSRICARARGRPRAAPTCSRRSSGYSASAPPSASPRTRSRTTTTTTTTVTAAAAAAARRPGARGLRAVAAPDAAAAQAAAGARLPLCAFVRRPRRLAVPAARHR